MISYVVMSNNEEILKKNLLRSLILEEGDEIIVSKDKPSAAVALNAGIAKAKNKIKCFVHSDVVILDNARLRSELLEHCDEKTGMVGIIGSKGDGLAIPWWETDGCGSVIEARLGPINFDDGGCEASVMDGFLLATAQDVRFDESFPGFHVYDYDICLQMQARGFPNFCLKDGRSLVSHNCKGPLDTQNLGDTYSGNLERLKTKWLTEASHVPMLQAH